MSFQSSMNNIAGNIIGVSSSMISSLKKRQKLANDLAQKVKDAKEAQQKKRKEFMSSMLHESFNDESNNIRKE